MRNHWVNADAIVVVQYDASTGANEHCQSCLMLEEIRGLKKEGAKNPETTMILGKSDFG